LNVRFLTSFNEATYKKLFGEKHARLQALENKLRRQVELEVQKKVKRMEKGIEQLLSNQHDNTNRINIILQLGAKVQLQLAPLLLEPQRTEIFTLAPGEEILTTNNTSAAVIESPAIHNARESQFDTNEEPNLSVLPEREVLRDQFSTRSDTLKCIEPLIELYSRHMQALVDVTSKATQLSVNVMARHRIMEWTTCEHSEALWIQGAYGMSNPTQMTLTAVCLVALTTQNDIPCLSYSCSLSAADVSEPEVDSPEKTLMNLIKSLIVQIVLLLPERLPNSNSLSLARFNRLIKDDEQFDFDEGLRLLEDLQPLMPAYVHCIIEGAQKLEDRDNKSHMNHVQHMLRILLPFNTSWKTDTSSSEVDSHAGEQRVFKICFTSDGFVDCLAQLADDERLHKFKFADEPSGPWAEDGQRLIPPWTAGL
jgi:hypothetical protein